MQEHELPSQLSPEQVALLINYREKWSSPKFLLKRPDFCELEEAIEQAYHSLDKAKPKIVFCESPNQLVKRLSKLKNLPIIPLMSMVWELRRQLPRAGQMGFRSPREIKHLEGALWNQLYFALVRQLGAEIEEAEHTDRYLGYVSWFDFCISVLGFSCNLQYWQTLQGIIRGCGYIFPLETTCLISARPVALKFDALDRIHAECEPAIVYADNFNLYFHHGIGLPEKYGKLPTNQWKTCWLFEEQNERIRRALISGIGYARISQELQLTELDSNNGYTLLRIENNHNAFVGLPIILLRKNDSDTKNIRVLEVPIDCNRVDAAYFYRQATAKVFFHH